MDDINADEYSEDSDNESIVEEENLVDQFENINNSLKDQLEHCVPQSIVRSSVKYFPIVNQGKRDSNRYSLVIYYITTRIKQEEAQVF